MTTARPPFIRAQDWQRMSWHQRQRAAQAASRARREREAAGLQPTFPPVPAEPLPTDARNAIRMICALLDRELTAAHQAAHAAGRARRYPPIPCGSSAAYYRHLRAGEEIDEACRQAATEERRKYDRTRTERTAA